VWWRGFRRVTENPQDPFSEIGPFNFLK